MLFRSHLIRQALAAGHEVLSLSRRAAPSAPRLLGISAPIDSPPWVRICGFQPDVLVHTAWEATPGVYLESPENPRWVDWSEALVEGAREEVLRTLGEAGAGARTDSAEMQTDIRRALRRYFNRRLERKPVIVPVLLEL